MRMDHPVEGGYRSAFTVVCIEVIEVLFYFNLAAILE
jgi:hypothetical protein